MSTDPNNRGGSGARSNQASNATPAESAAQQQPATTNALPAGQDTAAPTHAPPVAPPSVDNAPQNATAVPAPRTGPGSGNYVRVPRTPGGFRAWAGRPAGPGGAFTESPHSASRVSGFIQENPEGDFGTPTRVRRSTAATPRAPQVPIVPSPQVRWFMTPEEAARRPDDADDSDATISETEAQEGTNTPVRPPSVRDAQRPASQPRSDADAARVASSGRARQPAALDDRPIAPPRFRASIQPTDPATSSSTATPAAAITNLPTSDDEPKCLHCNKGTVQSNVRNLAVTRMDTPFLCRRCRTGYTHHNGLCAGTQQVYWIEEAAKADYACKLCTDGMPPQSRAHRAAWFEGKWGQGETPDTDKYMRMFDNIMDEQDQ